MNQRNTHLSEIISFYKGQLARFDKIGIGNKTEFNTTITERLIDTTRFRLSQLLSKREQLYYKGRENGTK